METAALERPRRGSLARAYLELRSFHFIYEVCLPRRCRMQSGMSFIRMPPQ